MQSRDPYKSKIATMSLSSAKAATKLSKESKTG